jgi:hypothetical protein
MEQVFHRHITTFGTVSKVFFLCLVLYTPSLVYAEPRIWFKSIPAYGDINRIVKGKVSGVQRKRHRVIVYLAVNGRWWGPKPYWNDPYTKIKSSGKWAADVTTGGIDELATTYIAFLIRDTYVPPSLAGQSTLPNELASNAVAFTQAVRAPPR